MLGPLVMTTRAQFVMNTVSYNVGGEIGTGPSVNGGPPDRRQWGDADVALSSLPYSGVSLTDEFEETFPNLDGEASLSAFVTARAESGALRVGLLGSMSAHTAGGLGPVQQSRSTMHNGQVTARWQDTAIVGTPEHAGRPLRWEGIINVQGDFDINPVVSDIPAGTYVGAAGSAATLSVRLTSPVLPAAPYPEGDWGALGKTSDGVVTSRPPDRQMRVSYTMIEGQPFTLDYALDLICSASAGLATDARVPLTASVFFNADFTHTVSWGGTASLTDLTTGLPVTDYTITASSGADYRYAIPEPGSLLLVAGALPVLLARRGQRPRIIQ